jgi:TetR/AcrR family tetracycline transcriptional repressor
VRERREQVTDGRLIGIEGVSSIDDIRPTAPPAGADPDTSAVAAPLRGSLDRDRIVAEAVAFVDEVSLQQLTMRRLGQRLGVEAMSLYRYVDGREDLLDAMVEHVLAGLDADPRLRLLPTDGWQSFLQRLAHGVRDVALAHPKVFPLVATRHPDAPWLRPPLRSLDLVEAFLDGLVDRGFDDQSAVAAYRAFSSFLLGHLLLEVSALGAATGPAEEPLADAGGRDAGRPGAARSGAGGGPRRTAVVSTGSASTGSASTGSAANGSAQPREDEDALAGHPNLQRLERLLSEDRSRSEFEVSLESLLQRLELTLD